MKEGFWGYALIILGIIIISVMIFMQNMTTIDQQDYYLVKEISDAALKDAIDLGCYQETGTLRIVKEKFVESFVRRFAENATLNKKYTINFYQINESPPLATVEVIANTGETVIDDEEIDANVVTRVTSILEIK